MLFIPFHKDIKMISLTHCISLSKSIFFLSNISLLLSTVIFFSLYVTFRFSFFIVLFHCTDSLLFCSFFFLFPLLSFVLRENLRPLALVTVFHSFFSRWCISSPRCPILHDHPLSSFLFIMLSLFLSLREIFFSAPNGLPFSFCLFICLSYLSCSMAVWLCMALWCLPAYFSASLYPLSMLICLLYRSYYTVIRLCISLWYVPIYFLCVSIFTYVCTRACTYTYIHISLCFLWEFFYVRY